MAECDDNEVDCLYMSRWSKAIAVQPLFACLCKVGERPRATRRVHIQLAHRCIGIDLDFVTVLIPVISVYSGRLDGRLGSDVETSAKIRRSSGIFEVFRRREHGVRFALCVRWATVIGPGPQSR